MTPIAETEREKLRALRAQHAQRALANERRRRIVDRAERSEERGELRSWRENYHYLSRAGGVGGELGGISPLSFLTECLETRTSAC